MEVTEISFKLNNEIFCEEISMEQDIDTEKYKKMANYKGIPTGDFFRKKNVNILRRGYKASQGNRKIHFKFGKEVANSFVIPGLIVTNVLGETCADMVPQGITYYDGYYFVSAYCKAHQHNSVIYVIESETLQYVTTLVLKGKPHAGGITYAGGYMWVCGTSRVFYYKFDVIREAIKLAGDEAEINSFNLSEYGGEIKLQAGEKASFVTTYEGLLCIGAYEADEKKGGMLRFYKPKPSMEFKCLTETLIPAKAQGIDFLKKDNETYMLITSSYGITRSKIYVYKKYEDNIFKMIKKITFPRMLEEVVVKGDYTYCIFESAAKKYRIPLMSVIGEVCGFSNEFIVSHKED